jgi:hypothetical protein
MFALGYTGKTEIMRRIASLVSLLLLLAVAAGSTAAPAPNVRGVLVPAASAGGCYSGEPCDPPLPPLFVVFSQSQHVVARARLGAGGAFALHLAPGRYTVTTAPPHADEVTPSAIRVPHAGVLRVRLVLR